MKEEVEFVSDYLELEKFRFGDKFDYEISIDSEINREVQVPKMCIQTYVENAINHGIMNKETKGHLLITVHKINSKIEINVKDDGAGREYMKNHPSHSTGKGFIIMEKNFKLFTQLTKKEVLFTITDLYDNNSNAVGTLVKTLIDI